MAVWRERGSTLLLKPFLQAASMQFLFDSYPYESQRRITRLLLGLLPDIMPDQFYEDGVEEEKYSELSDDEE